MEPYPYHYSRRSRPEEPADPSVRPVDPNVCLMLDELQHMESRLSDRIDGRCGGLERRVADVEQKAEERFIALEMLRIELDSGRAEIERQFDGLKLEVHRMNRLLEHENLERAQGKPQIFSTNGSTFGVSSSATAEGAGAPAIDLLLPRPDQDTSHHASVTREEVRSGDSQLARSNASTYYESVRATQGRLLKIQFPIFSGDDPLLWKSRCENYFDMYGVESSLWVRVASMHLDGTTTRWF
jgi:hypothetical protein